MSKLKLSRIIKLFYFLVQSLFIITGSQSSVVSYYNNSNNNVTSTSANGTTVVGADRLPECVDGLMLSAWQPVRDLSVITRIYRGTIYFLGLIYVFLGVSIVSDRFMAAIEVITSQEREIVIRKKKGTAVQKIKVRVWNETVANLTLMALGSSAPEILLSIIEIIGKNYVAGELGPGTIVGSAAYNLFLIIALCVYVVPDGEVRRIRHLCVFFVTSLWSIFAYIWMYVILAVISVGVVDVWEALLTFAFFPATVLTAYLADRKLKIQKFEKFRLNKNRVIVATESRDDDVEMEREIEEEILEESSATDPHHFAIILRDLKKSNPLATLKELEKLASEEFNKRTHKSKAFYRLRASKNISGITSQSAAHARREASLRRESSLGSGSASLVNNKTTRVLFQPDCYAVLESVGQFEVTVIRQGGEEDLSQQTVVVQYGTADGTAIAGSDYVGQSGTLVFKPGETRKTIVLSVIDDDVFEEDEHFYVHLKKAVIVRQPNGEAASIGSSLANLRGGISPKENDVLGESSTATVIILDDDHCGVFGFAESTVRTSESAGTCRVEVIRSSGAKGRIRVPYCTLEGSAKFGKHFVETRGNLIFENNEPRKEIEITIIEENCYEKNVSFYIVLESPAEIDEAGEVIVKPNKEDELNIEETIAQDGRPRIGLLSKVEVVIKESDEFKNTVNKLVEEGLPTAGITSSWSEQFCNAFRIVADDDDDEEAEGKEPRKRTCCEYLTHSLTFIWKLLFAFIPPPELSSGYLCFIVSIIVIGILTSVIGDLASHFGCTVGLKDSVTAVTFVALGTSVPDTFASKVAAIQDSTADNSVGNVTGSNAVNVFLGIGITWSIAAIYHAAHGNKFRVDPGNLAFCVTLFVSEAALTILILLLRRSKSIGGELGGPRSVKIVTALILISFWIFYVTMTTLEAYGVIKGF